MKERAGAEIRMKEIHARKRKIKEGTRKAGDHDKRNPRTKTEKAYHSSGRKRKNKNLNFVNENSSSHKMDTRLQILFV